MIALYSYLTAKMSTDLDVINLYNGVDFESKLIFILINFLMLACYCLYIYNEFETYIYEYGIYIVVREHSRKKILGRLIVKLLLYIFLIEFIKIFIYICFMLILRGGITISSPLETLKMVSIYLGIYILMLLIQMMLELYFTGKVALIAVLGYYLFNIGLGSMIYRTKSLINICLVPNLAMKFRLDILMKDYNLSYLNILTFLISLIFITLLVSRHLFVKKDIL